MGKRISRRELKEKIKDLSFELRTAEYRLSTAIMGRDALKQRLTELGSKAENFDVRGSGMTCIEVEPKAWGSYCVIPYGEKMTEDDTEHLKEELARNIARGLMEENMIQIIDHHQDMDPLQGRTIAAKVYVVPWDKMVKKLVIKA